MPGEYGRGERLALTARVAVNVLVILEIEEGFFVGRWAFPQSLRGEYTEMKLAF
jgi:hypothetical protein